MVSMQGVSTPGSGVVAGRIERRGIEYIPHRERRGKPIGLAWMWAGAILNVEYVVYGAIAMSFGLSFLQALVVILIGNLSFILTGLASLPGPAAGTTTFGTNRAAFGPNGNRFISFFNWIQQVGYEVFSVVLIVLAALALLAKAGVHSSDTLKVVLLIAGVLLQGTLPLFGHSAMLRILTLLVVPFIVLFVLLAILTVGKAHVSSSGGANFPTVLGALALIISSSGLGWTANASDYSRYLRPDSSRRGIIWSAALGGMVPSTLLMLLGAAIYTVTTGASDPISGLPHAFPGWFVVPYLLFVIAQLCAINAIDLYSSGVTLQAIGLPTSRFTAVVIDTIVCFILATITVFSSGFYTIFSDFLLFLIIWFSPWTAIYLIDYFLRRGRYDARSLMDVKAGLYWRKNGFRVSACIAQVVGMIASAAWINTSVWKGPLSSATNGADVSVFMGLVFGGVIYFLLARREVPAEAEATASAEEIDGRLTEDLAATSA